MPISRAIAAAVVLWSPVIMIVFIPDDFASSTALKTSSRGGSIIAIRPIKIKSFSSSKVGSNSSETFL